MTIEVTDSTIATQLAALGRYLLTAGGAFALGKGWVDDDTLQFLTGLLTVAAPAAWGIYRAYANKRRLIDVAQDARVPDSVARVL